MSRLQSGPPASLRNSDPTLSRAAGAPEPRTAAKGSLLLGALRRRGHKEGLPSGRRAINNPEAVGSAALFKDGGGGTSAAKAGAAGQRLRRYGLRERCPTRLAGARLGRLLPRSSGRQGHRGSGAACDGALHYLFSPPPHNGSRAAATPGRAWPQLGLSREPGAGPGPLRLGRSRGIGRVSQSAARALAVKPRPRPGPSRLPFPELLKGVE